MGRKFINTDDNFEYEISAVAKISLHNKTEISALHKCLSAQRNTNFNHAETEFLDRLEQNLLKLYNEVNQ